MSAGLCVCVLWKCLHVHEGFSLCVWDYIGWACVKSECIWMQIYRCCCWWWPLCKLKAAAVCCHCVCVIHRDSLWFMECSVARCHEWSSGGVFRNASLQQEPLWHQRLWRYLCWNNDGGMEPFWFSLPLQPITIVTEGCLGRFSVPCAAELYTGCSASLIGVVPVCNEFRPRGSDCLDNTDKLLSFGLVWVYDCLVC